MDKTVCPLVTVVTTTYKKFEYLEENIKSVLKQKYSPIEYIIADDGSGNFPLENVKRLIEENKKDNIVCIRYFISKENHGTVKNLGNAYHNANGEILMPLSGDDQFFNEEVVSNVVNAFSTKKCEALSVSRVAIDEKSKFAYYLPHINDYKKIAKFNTSEGQYYALTTGKFYNMASGSVLYLKKEMFERLGGYDERFILWEDSPFLLKMFSNGVKIETEYSIKGIFYRLGGISTGNINPQYLKDKELYNLILLHEHYATLPDGIKKYIDHNLNSALCKTKVQKLYLYLHDWRIMFDKFCYELNEKIGEQKDRYIKEDHNKIFK